MKRIAIAVILAAVIILAGCLNTSTTKTTQSKACDSTSLECTEVNEKVPYTERVCANTTSENMKCSVRELSQKVGKVEEVELCAYGSGCTGEKISDCRECRTAMKRCRMTVTNTDTVAGTWIADAVFFYKTASFVKTPESATIEPGKSYTFDFYQMYTLDPRPTSATCALTIASRGTIETCYMETTIIENCEDVTKIEMVKSEICG